MASGARLEYNFFDQIADNLQANVGAVVLASGLRIAARAQQKMSGPKHGRTYQVGKISRSLLKSERGQLQTGTLFGKVRVTIGGQLTRSGLIGGSTVILSKKGRLRVVTGAKIHRASAPGEAPAVDTGHLKNSVVVKMIGPTTAEITFNAEQAAALEFGGAHVAPRPFLTPSVEEEKDDFFQAVGELLL